MLYISKKSGNAISSAFYFIWSFIPLGGFVIIVVPVYISLKVPLSFVIVTAKLP
ncbi:hypothetical protein ACFSR2_06705 [Emticicia soli]|uniref:Uncharacterized protein n=1 Tax=Emticicia soli TaxID=2027878 RepID=A0ABW5J6W0_9BACT